MAERPTTEGMIGLAPYRSAGRVQKRSPIADRYFLTPEGAAVSSAGRTRMTLGEVGSGPDNAPVTSAHHLEPSAAAPSGPPPEWLPLYVKRALELGDPHSTRCPCFMCASIREAIGHMPIAVEPVGIVTRDGARRGREAAS